MKLSLAIGLAALAIGGPAFAQPPGGPPSPEMHAARQAMMQACSADLKTLCDGKQGREMMMCLRENEPKASQPCKDALAKLPRRQPPPAG